MTGMPPGMMPSIAAGIPPGATLTIPGGYLGEGTQRGRLGMSELTTRHPETGRKQAEIPLLEPSSGSKLQGVAQC